jgi:SAM-dependent methyltransferase
MAWGDVDRTLVSGESAFDRVHGQTVWQWLDAHPLEREGFAQAMTGLSVAHAPAIAALYPFREVRSVCDVGGGTGTLITELMLRFPHLDGTLCDVPGVLESARALIAQRGLSCRVQLAPGSIFDRVPTGSDAYVLKNVLHDWDDEASVRILENCRRAMVAHGRLLIAELIVEPHEDTGLGPLSDAHMLVATSGGRERSEAELSALATRAGLRAQRVFHSPIISVMETRRSNG